MVDTARGRRESGGFGRSERAPRISTSTALGKATVNDEHVRSHYNSLKNNNRKHSKLSGLRDFNNFVKWLLIFQNSDPYEVVIDMACGKGGDLEKWRRSGIDGLIGIDIADQSIRNAEERYRMLSHKTYWIDLVVGNCFGDDIHDMLPPEALPVDAVSCQFALHYAFDTEERIRRTLSNVSQALRRGGRFFGTIPNSEYLAENLRAGRTEWGNSIFRIEFDKPHPDGKFDSIAGNRYTFYLSEAVNNVPEYVVPFDAFVDLAKEYNLVLKQREPFLSLFDKNVQADEGVRNEAIDKRLTNERGIPTLDPEHLEACSIYLAFVFEKV